MKKLLKNKKKRTINTSLTEDKNFYNKRKAYYLSEHHENYLKWNWIDNFKQKKHVNLHEDFLAFTFSTASGIYMSKEHKIDSMLDVDCYGTLTTSNSYDTCTLHIEETSLIKNNKRALKYVKTLENNNQPPFEWYDKIIFEKDNPYEYRKAIDSKTWEYRLKGKKTYQAYSFSPQVILEFLLSLTPLIKV